MITITGCFAKSRCYVVQTRSAVTAAERRRNRRDAEAGWSHCAQFNYDGKEVLPSGRVIRVGDTKDQALMRAELFATNKEGLYDDHEFRVVNMTVKQAHKAKTANYQPTGEIRKLKPEFDYDKKCARHPTIPHVTGKRKTADEKLGATALAMPIRNDNDTKNKQWERLRKAMAYYEFAQNL